MRFTKSVTFLLTFLTFIFAQTANLSLTNYDADSGSVDIYMVNDTPVGGFQFEFLNPKYIHMNYLGYNLVSYSKKIS